MELKKIVIVVVVFLLLGLMGIIIPLSLHYDTVQMEKDMIAHVMSTAEGELIASRAGQTTKVTGRNIDRIASALTPTERQRLFRKPAFDEADAIFLNFPNGASFIIAEVDPELDKAIVVYRYKRKIRYLSINGYKTFSWISRAVSPEGVYNENELLSEAG